MKNRHLEAYKERQSRRSYEKLKDIATILTIPSIIAGIISAIVILICRSEILLIFLTVFLDLLILGAIVFYYRKRIFKKLAPKEYFVSDFDFREPNDDTLSDAIEGIFSFSKSQPHFIHVTSPNKEIKEIIKAFREGGTNFIHIHGKPGEGKSMLAYHAIYQMKKYDVINCSYSLKLDALIYKTEDAINDILHELDGLPSDDNDRSQKLILIDDAHRLPFAYELEKQLRIEAEQGNGCFIWITTDLNPFETTKKKTGELSINFQAYYMQLVNTLYKSEDIRIQKLMEGRYPKLELAIAQTKYENEPSGKQKGILIKDAWTFNFVASDGFKQLKEDILILIDEEKYILFLLSAHTSITGEIPLSVPKFYDICVEHKPEWFQLSFDRFKEILNGLFEQKPEKGCKVRRRMMLRLIKDTQNNVSIESLHFLFATSYLREISQTFSKIQRLEMLYGMKALLDDDWKKFRYLSSFIFSINNDAQIFFEQNVSWLKEYFENLEQDHLSQYSHIIKLLYKYNYPLFTEIFTDEYFHRCSSLFNQLPIYRLSALAHLIDALPSGMRLKLVRELNAITLSETISKVTIENFTQAADLLNAFDNRKEELLKELIKVDEKTKENKLGHIIEEISKATIENIKQAADLINAFGNRKEELLKELIKVDERTKENKLSHIIEEISKASIETYDQAAQIINAFGNRKEELLKDLIKVDEKTKENKLGHIIDEISKASIDNFGQVEAIVNAFGSRKEELLKELIKVDEKTKENKLGHIIEEISKATIENFGQVEAIINAFGKEKDKLVSRIDFSFLNKQVNKWQVDALILISELINVLNLKATRILLPFSEDNFLSLSHQIEGKHISPFVLIVSRLPALEQVSVVNKIQWLELLIKIPCKSPFQFNSIAHIMDFYQRTMGNMPDDEMKKPLLEYLINNRSAIKHIVYNLKPNHYAAFYDSLLILALVDLQLISGILKEVIIGFCKHFEISLEISAYVSRLLYLFYTIDPIISFKIICHEIVKKSLKNYLCSTNINENPDGTRFLIKAIRNSNKKLWEEEFLKDEMIFRNLNNLDLLAIYKEQDEDRNKLNTLGLNYFKTDKMENRSENTKS